MEAYVLFICFAISSSEKWLRVSKTESYGLSRICFEMTRQAIMPSSSEKCLRVSKTESYGISRICFEMMRQATMPSSKAWLCLADEQHKSCLLVSTAIAILRSSLVIQSLWSLCYLKGTGTTGITYPFSGSKEGVFQREKIWGKLWHSRCTFSGVFPDPISITNMIWSVKGEWLLILSVVKLFSDRWNMIARVLAHFLGQKKVCFQVKKFRASCPTLISADVLISAVLIWRNLTSEGWMTPILVLHWNFFLYLMWEYLPDRWNMKADVGGRRLGSGRGKS
jgi:hypothetical protein